MKTIILGPPFVGKSTIVRYLRENYPSVLVEELDEGLIRLNGGVWPSDEKFRNEVLLPKVIEEVINSTHEVIFFTSYISIEDIEKAKRMGFNVLQLYCDKEILISRNIKKDMSRQSEMERNIKYQDLLIQEGLADRRLEANGEVKDIVLEILKVHKKD
jgi:dephospho-CoA kinase